MNSWDVISINMCLHNGGCCVQGNNLKQYYNQSQIMKYHNTRMFYQLDKLKLKLLIYPWLQHVNN